MALDPVGGSDVGTSEYQLVGAISTYRNGPNQTLVPIEEITARSTLYDVEYTFAVTMQTFQGTGAQVLASEKTAYVNEIGGMAHVVGLRGEQDTGADGNVYNFLVITVGTPDGLITTDARLRMDHLGTGAEVPLIANAWKHLQDLGA